MNSTIARRGPDGEGILVDGPAGLAMRRLAIIDIAGGNQPIFNEDRSVAVVFNGEIYNYRELRKSLEQRGHRFATASDTEVIVHLYEDHGAGCADFLEGMFAFALWDRTRRRLLLARDSLGIKPMFVARVPDGIVFGSEIKAVLASGIVERRLDVQAFDQYMSYGYVLQPRTIYRGIHKLQPGASLLIEADKEPIEQRYWTPRQVMPRRIADDDCEAQCEELLVSAVSSHLVSDVPVGAFLSGGIDSSLVVAMAARASTKPILSFTVGFTSAGSAFLDERKYARMMADRYGLEHLEIDVEPHVADVIGDIVAAFDEPFADDSVIPSYYVSQGAARHVKVALTGLGGDELFGGYKRYLGMQLSECYLRIPEILRNAVARPLIEAIPEPKSGNDSVDRLKRFVRADEASAAQRYASYLQTTDSRTQRELYAADLANRITKRHNHTVLENTFDTVPSSGVVDAALRTDLETYLVDDILTLTDRLSMWHSLELRVPFLDRKLVEFVVSLPANLKVRRNQQKWLLRRIARKWLPPAILQHKKQGFEAPMGAWLRGPLRPMFEDIVTRKAVEETGLFKYAVIQRLLAEHVAGTRKHSRILFCVLMAQLWSREAHFAFGQT